LAATGIAKHREAQVSIGWHSQHGQQGNTCCTATRLFRKGTSPEREVKKKKSGATTTLPPLYTENHQFSKTISARFSSHVSFSDFIILVVVIVVCQFFFNDRRGCRMTRSGRATGAGTSGVSGVELQTEWALIKGAVLVPMPEAVALETSQVVRGVRWSKGTKDWGRSRRVRVQLFNVLQCGLKMERIDSEGLLGVNLTGGR